MLKNEDRVLVVGAKHALKEYQDFSVYVCQERRFFRPTRRMAFYSDKTIHRFVPRILGSIENINLSEADILSREDIEDWQRHNLLKIVRRLQAGQAPEWARLNRTVKVTFLSEKTSPDTLILSNRIPNQDNSKLPFVQHQTYVSLKELLEAKTTAELQRETGWKGYKYPYK